MHALSYLTAYWTGLLFMAMFIVCFRFHFNSWLSTSAFGRYLRQLCPPLSSLCPFFAFAFVDEFIKVSINCWQRTKRCNKFHFAHLIATRQQYIDIYKFTYAQYTIYIYRIYLCFYDSSCSALCPPTHAAAGQQM